MKRSARLSLSHSPPGLLLLVGSILVVVACGSSDEPQPAQGTPDASSPVPSNPLPPPPPAPTPSSTGEKPPLVVNSEVSPIKPKFQAKSSAQLASSVANCVGPNATKITAAMLLGNPSPGGFLTGDFAVDQDIIAVQTSLFDGNLESLRTSVRVDQITLEYITGLKNMGNVVGYRCMQGLASTPSLCACDTFTDAYAMLSRCLGTVADPSSPDFTLLAAEFQAACQANKGTAIASLVASSAFAKLP